MAAPYTCRETVHQEAEDHTLTSRSPRATLSPDADVRTKVEKTGSWYLVFRGQLSTVTPMGRQKTGTESGRGNVSESSSGYRLSKPVKKKAEVTLDGGERRAGFCGLTGFVDQGVSFSHRSLVAQEQGRSPLDTESSTLARAQTGHAPETGPAPDTGPALPRDKPRPCWRQAPPPRQAPTQNNAATTHHAGNKPR